MSKEEMKSEENYFEGFEGQGLDNMGQDAVSTAYLGMVQPGSTAENEQPAGTWRNSATGENLGSEVEVVILAFKTVWTERSSEPPYLTVGRYEPNSIPVDIERPKPGQRGFPKMINPQTKNRVEELFVYAVMRPDRPEDGIMYFSPTATSMKTCKRLNSQLKSQRLPNGNLSPIFGYSWKLELELVQNPANPSNAKDQITRFAKATVGTLVTKDLFQEAVLPQVEAAQGAALLAAPEMSGDTEQA